MSRMILTALAVSLAIASTASAQSVWQQAADDQPIHLVSWDGAEPEKPTYDDLQEQLSCLGCGMTNAGT